MGQRTVQSQLRTRNQTNQTVSIAVITQILQVKEPNAGACLRRKTGAQAQPSAEGTQVLAVGHWLCAGLSVTTQGPRLKARFIKIRCHRLDLSGTPEHGRRVLAASLSCPMGPALPRVPSGAPVLTLRLVNRSTLGLRCSMEGLFIVHSGPHTHTCTRTHTHQPTGGSLQRAAGPCGGLLSTTTCVRPTSKSFHTEQRPSKCLRELEKELEGKDVSREDPAPWARWPVVSRLVSRGSPVSSGRLLERVGFATLQVCQAT